MSQESLQWLRDNVRYNANHRRAWWDDGGTESDAARFDGPVPLDEVQKLFSWTPVAGKLTTMVEVDGERIPVVDPDRQVIVRPDTREVMGVFKSGYRIHDYQTWLTETTANLLDTDQNEMDIASVGLLRKGAVGWLTVEANDTADANGVAFRPFITAATSLDGSLATTYNRGVSLPICDNTLSAALNTNNALRIKFRHSAGSLGKLSEVRAALDIMAATAEDFTSQMETLTGTDVSDKQWAAILDAAVPLPEVKVTKGGGPGAGYTFAEHKRDELTRLYRNDPRVAPYAGTAFGALQAFNTYAHHSGIVRGAAGGRTERNIEREVTGQFEKADQDTFDTIAKVLEKEMVFA
jgi:phage/plasmid-like protein (TIGR03299 family)